MINYNVNYEGILRVYYDNYILFEISDCADMNDDEIKRLIEDELKERGVNYGKNNL